MVRWNRIWTSAGQELAALDPGGIRREAGFRAALATLTAWIATQALIGIFCDRAMPEVRIWAVAVCFLCFLVVIDQWPARRRVTTLLTPAATAGALVLSALMGESNLLLSLVLLAGVFLSIAVRRSYPWLGTLCLFGVMTLTFGWTARVAFDPLGWFLLGSIVGIGSAYLWQFVLLPRSAGDTVNRVLESLFDNGARAMLAARDEVSGAAAVDGLGRRDQAADWLARVHTSRRIIEREIAVAHPISEGMKANLNDLRLAINAFERGLTQIVDAARDLARHRHDIPSALQARLTSMMDALRRLAATGAYEDDLR